MAPSDQELGRAVFAKLYQRDSFADAFGARRGLNATQRAEQEGRRRALAAPRAYSVRDSKGTVSACYYLHNDPVAAVLHRADGPALITIYATGRVSQRYYWHGVLHREDGPVLIVSDGAGILITERYYRDGQLHREDGPAVIIHAGGGSSSVYYRGGVRVREDGPSMVETRQDCSWVEAYYRDRLLHREHGPAYIAHAADGTLVEERYCVDGKLHTP
jgi:hypothetical protein